MIRAKTIAALALCSTVWAGVGCGSADDADGRSASAQTGSAAGSGGSQVGTGGSSTGSGGAAGSGSNTGAGGAAGSGGEAGSAGAGGSGAAPGGQAGSGGSGTPDVPGVNRGTSTVDEEMLPPEPVYDDTGALYVSTDGNDDSGDGSMASPFRTVSHALEVGGAGALVVLRGTPYLGSGSNEYEGQVRIRDPHVTIRSAPGEWAVIRCGIDDASPATCVDFDVDASDGKLQRVEVIGGSYYGVAFETKWDWGEADRSGASRILLEDVKIHDTGRDAIKIKPGCDDIVIRRAEIYNSGASYAPDATGKNAEGIDNVNADRMVVQDSYIHDTATNGIYFKGGATDCVVERTLIERTGSGGLLVGFDTSPEFFDLDANPEYYESIRGIVRNNIIRDTECDGIGMYGAKNPMVFNNTVITAASDCHSPIYFGITFQDWDDSAGRPATISPVLANNVVVQPASLTVPVVGIRWSSELGGLSALNGNPDMDYNAYACSGGSCTFDDGRPDSPLEEAPFTQWQQHIGSEQHSSTVDPAVDATGHIGANSSAVDKGRAVPQVKLDFDRQARNGAFDLGADEYAAAP